MNTESGMPRATTRLAQLSVIRLLVLGLALAATVIAATIATRLLVPAAPTPLHDWVLLKNAILPLLLLAVYARTVHLLEHRRASELAGSPGIALFAAGLIGGVAVISGYVLVLSLAGVAHVAGGVTSNRLLGLSNEFLVPWLTAVGEELVFRAVLFRISEEMFGTAAAIAISAGLFGLSHAANPGANPVALVMLALGMGGLLALAFTATRNLWLPIGLHMGWNIAEGFLYGLPNSGMTDPLQLARTSISGSLAVTGGEFGPEASVVLVVLSFLISAILLWITLRAHRWTPVRFRLRQPVQSRWC